MAPFDDTMFFKKKVDVLSFFTDDQLRRVTSVVERNSYNQGQTVLFQGEVSSHFYVIKKGSLSVTAKSGAEKVDLLPLKAGDFFGEISILESSASQATLKALEDDTEILTIPHDAFQALLHMNPQLELLLREKIAQRKQQKAQAVFNKEGHL